MQPATHILDPNAEAGEGIRREVNLVEFDHAGPGRTDEAAALPIDAGVADRAFRIVPDR
jgi:hypothetical protein